MKQQIDIYFFFLSAKSYAAPVNYMQNDLLSFPSGCLCLLSFSDNGVKEIFGGKILSYILILYEEQNRMVSSDGTRDATH